MVQSANNLKTIVKWLFVLMMSAVIFSSMYDSILNRVIPYARVKLVEWNVVQPDLPEPEPPKPDISTDFFSTSLLNTQYVPSTNPFSEKDYEQTPKIIFKGEFAKADLQIKGDVKSNTPVFVMFNFGKTSGFVNAYRKSVNQIDIPRTQEMGGLFDEAIDLTINLLGNEIATSGKDYENTKMPTHFVQFLPSNKDVDTANLIAIPVDLSGKYGGAIITSMIINYTCAENSQDCSITRCEGLAYSCILERYTKSTADKWLEKYKAANATK